MSRRSFPRPQGPLPPAPGLRYRPAAVQLPPVPGQPARAVPEGLQSPLPAVRGQCVISLRLGQELAEVGQARAATSEALTGQGLGDLTDATLLIVSELATNAIRHGAGSVQVRISHDGHHLRVEVHDDGPGRPVRRPVTVEDESGHGLELIDGLLKEHGGTRDVTDDETGHGKTVQVAIRLPNRP